MEVNMTRATLIGFRSQSACKRLRTCWQRTDTGLFTLPFRICAPRPTQQPSEKSSNTRPPTRSRASKTVACQSNEERVNQRRWAGRHYSPRACAFRREVLAGKKGCARAVSSKHGKSIRTIHAQTPRKYAPWFRISPGVWRPPTLTLQHQLPTQKTTKRKHDMYQNFLSRKTVTPTALCEISRQFFKRICLKRISCPGKELCNDYGQTLSMPNHY